jgi:ankyrin repeat protein
MWRLFLGACLHPILFTRTACSPQVDLATSNGSTALHNAAANGHLPIVEMLLQKGCNARIQALSGATALYGAATGGFLDIVERLLEAKSEVNLPTSSGLTPLHTAASGNHFAVVEHLLSAGADKDYQVRC